MQYHFADCILDTDSYRLLRGGAQQQVEPQVFDLLRVLAENAGRLVSRDHLIETVWQGRIVSEATISARINAARSAVGDSGKEQAVIRTVPRRGIELAVPVTNGDAEAPAESPAPAPPTSQTIRYTTSVDGTQLAYAVSGAGPPLLRAAHQVTHLELDWQSPLWRPTLDALGGRHQLVRYDMRATGLSENDVAVADLEQHAEDLAAVADAAGLERFPILANLNGAAPAIRFAAENPDRVSHLVIQEGYARGRAMRGAGPAPAPAQGDPFMALMQAGGWGDPTDGHMRAWMSMGAPGLSYEDASRLIELIGAACTPEGSLISRESIDRFDARPWLAGVKAPTLVIHARNDILHPLAEGRLIAAGIEGAEFLVVESANSLCLPPDPTWEEQTQAILDFLARG